MTRKPALITGLAALAISAGFLIGAPAFADAIPAEAPAPAPISASAETTTPSRAEERQERAEERQEDREQRAEQRAQEPQARAEQRAEDRAERLDRRDRRVLTASQPTSQFGEVTVTGRGFPKRQPVEIVISSGSSVHARGYAQVGANGRFTATLGPEVRWHQGEYQVWVGYPGGTMEIALTIDTDLPSDGAAALDATVPAGPSDPITLSGGGFEPNTTLRVWVHQNGSSVLPVDIEVTTDATGSFSTTANPTTPWQANTTYTVGARDALGQQISHPFTTPAW